MSSSGKSVIVIGGGVIGAACSHYLRTAGWAVTIIDQNRFGAACSHGNCGYVCPSHVLPMAEPGVIGKTLKAMLSKSSPMYIKPRFSPALWGWLLNFARRCNEADMMSAGHAIAAMLESSLPLYRELVKSSAIDCEFQEHGLLYAYRDRAQLSAYSATNELLTSKFGHPAKRFDGDDILQLEPALKPGLAGGWYYEGDAHLRPDRLMSSWRISLESAGVKVMDGTTFEGFAQTSGRATAAQTSAGLLKADAYVVATGAWSPLLAKRLGCKLPIQPGKGYSITMPRPAICPVIPMIFPETRVAVTPWESGYRLGSTMEFAGHDTSINKARLGLLRQGAEPYLREAFCEPVQEEWYGWRPMTFDSMPIIGPSPTMANVMLATGHSMLGISMAPATGKLVSELLRGAKPHLDATPYSPTRF